MVCVEEFKFYFQHEGKPSELGTDLVRFVFLEGPLCYCEVNRRQETSQDALASLLSG